MANKVKMAVTAATVTMSLVAPAVSAENNPYVAGDMHNHNTCTDGSVSIGYAIDRSVGKGTAANGGNNFNLDWFTLGNHGGSGNRDCRFADTSANVPGEKTTLWTQTLGQTIQGTTVTSLKGTPNNGNMWRWQNIQEVEYPILAGRKAQYQKALIEGLEWIAPGHEHVDVAVLGTQFAKKGPTNADAMAEFEFRFDRADGDLVGQLEPSGKQRWPGKDSVNNNGTAGHGKSVAGVEWLQANYPLSSYVVPTHTERQGPFDPKSSRGYNIEHFRDFNNAGPTVAFGIEAPGHMGQNSLTGGTYGGGAVGGGTYGLSGVYTAKVGGLWDGLLGEGRNFFIYVSSDWHNRGIFGARDAGTTGDFIPGEYTKLYVPGKGQLSKLSGQDVIDGMRSGNSYSVNGDVIGPDMVFRASVSERKHDDDEDDNDAVGMGGTLQVRPGATVRLKVQVTVPAKNNSPYSFTNPLLAQVGIGQPLNEPSIDHIDLITGSVTGVIEPGAPGYAVPNAANVAGAAVVYNPTAQIAQQLMAEDAKKKVLADGSVRLSWQTSIVAGNTPFYIRARGTNIPVATPNVTDSAGNPLLDTNNAKVACTDPACPAHLDTVNGEKRVTYDVAAYSNLWFYANPIFVRPAGSPKLMVERNAELAAKLGGDDHSRGHDD